MGEKITITKRLAARSEIEAAIRELGAQNFPAVELLASAAVDVTAGVAKEHGVKTYSSEMFDAIKPEHHKLVAAKLRKPYNFMKHSDRDKSTAIDIYDPESCVWRLFQAIHDYIRCYGQQTILMSLFLNWVNARHPNIVTDQTALNLSRRAFGDVSNITFREALVTFKNQLDDFMDIVDELTAQTRRDAAFSGHIEF